MTTVSMEQAVDVTAMLNMMSIGGGDAENAGGCSDAR